jgi:two-component system response regulator DegU
VFTLKMKQEKSLGMKVIIVDDNKTFRNGLKSFLVNILGFEVVGEFNDGLSCTKGEYADADIILMDLNMPVQDGVTSAKEINWYYSKAKIIAVTQNSTFNMEKLIGAGFSGLVFKKDVFQQLEEAMQKVVNGKYSFPKT